MSRPLGDPVQRFWSKVNKKGPYPNKEACRVHPEIKGTRCWERFGSGGGGYVRFGIIENGKWTTVDGHRFAYELKHGKGSLGKKCCLHKCDNRRCVRWSHLFKGTHKQNTRDMMNKGRKAYGEASNLAKGAECHTAKLSEDKVLRIRRLYKQGNYTQKKLSQRFGVSTFAISSIISRKSWAHV